jgi:hypothetical protein
MLAIAADTLRTVSFTVVSSLGTRRLPVHRVGSIALALLLWRGSN